MPGTGDLALLDALHRRDRHRTLGDAALGLRGGRRRDAGREIGTWGDDSQVQEINCSTFRLEKVVEPTRS